MSTRSVIGILQDDKTVNSVYCHFDKGVWKCYETSDPTKPAPARTIPDTSNYYDADKQMFVYGFSKVSRIKELAQ
jgi:hypothetical protein